MKDWTRRDSLNLGLITLCIVLVEVAYLTWASVIAGAWGYPIDDAWIHQVFARNLAETGMLAFNRNVASTGISAPIWTVLIAPGYLLPVGPLAWTLLLGILAHWGIGLLVYLLGRKMIGGMNSRPFAFAAALLTVVEWHLAWASLSGMETSFFILLSLVLIYLNLNHAPWAWRGIIGGLLTATRPEGALLFGLVLGQSWRTPLKSLIVGILFWGATLAPSLLYNLGVGASLLPNTYTAKAVVLEAQPGAWLAFLLEFGVALLLGPSLIIIPFALFVIRAFRERKAEFYLPLAWITGLTLVYTLRLPITFHHMRYLMPVLPWVVLVGAAGLSWMQQRNPSQVILHLVCNAIIALILVAEGANVYAWNVENINHQQVAVGNWIRENTATEALVASGDIGAVGYFAQRHVIDLAGLVTPDIVPYLRARQSVAPYLCAQHADYVIVFPQYHADLFANLQLEEVYRQHLVLNTITPGADLVVYALRGCTGVATSVPP